MYSKIKILCLVLPTFFLSEICLAQPELTDLNQSRREINETGMLILGGWALTNIASGAILSATTNGEEKYFHQMNMAWNTVNLGIAGFGYFGARSQNDSLPLAESMQEQVLIGKLLLLNAGLDLAYITGGVLLLEHKNADKRMRGYGRSLIVQGSFLFMFDVVLYLFHQNNNIAYFKLLENLQISNKQIGVQIRF